MAKSSKAATPHTRLFQTPLAIAMATTMAIAIRPRRIVAMHRAMATSRSHCPPILTYRAVTDVLLRRSVAAATPEIDVTPAHLQAGPPRLTSGTAYIG